MGKHHSFTHCAGRICHSSLPITQVCHSSLRVPRMYKQDPKDPDEEAPATTLLVHAVRCRKQPVISALLSAPYPINLNEVDAEGKTAIMYAVIENDLELLQLLLEPVSTRNDVSVDLSVASRYEGWTALHYVVRPHRFGSYENVDMLNLLAKHTKTVDLKDAHGRTPSFYAHLQDTGKMLDALNRCGAAPLIRPPHRQQSLIDVWPEHG